MQLRSKYVKIVCSVLMAVAPLLQPLYVNADTITQANIIGTNVYTEPISNEYIAGTNNNAVSNTAIVHIDIELDQSYLGWINLGISVKIKNYYYGANPAYWGDTNVSLSGNYYVNGSTVSINVPISWNSQQLGYQMGSPTHLPNSSSDITLSLTNQGNVTPIGDLSTLQDILVVLQDIQENVEIDVMSELQQIVIDLGLSNQYLEKISKYRQWNVPFESMGFISYLLSYGYQEFEFRQYEPFNFPMFIVPKNNNIYAVYLSPNRRMTFIFGSSLNLNYAAAVIQYLNLPSDLTVENAQMIDTIYFKNQGYQSYSYICRFDLINNTSSGITAYLKSTTTDLLIIPIIATFDPSRVSTEFALRFGLSNKLLDDLNIIAQGTNQSNQSASSESAVNQQFASDSQDLMNFEDTMSNNMDTQLQQINTNFDVGNTFGSKFLTSAEWVRNQFNTITNNTPFGTFISFSLLIGLSLLLVGKFL